MEKYYHLAPPQNGINGYFLKTDPSIHQDDRVQVAIGSQTMRAELKSYDKLTGVVYTLTEFDSGYISFARATSSDKAGDRRAIRSLDVFLSNHGELSFRGPTDSFTLEPVDKEKVENLRKKETIWNVTMASAHLFEK